MCGYNAWKTLFLNCRDEQTQNVAEAAAETTAPAGDVAGEMDINEALRRVLKAAIVADGLVRGLREAAKALDKRQAHLCILATNCQEPLYIKLVEALCTEHNIPLLKVYITYNCLLFLLLCIIILKWWQKCSLFWK